MSITEKKRQVISSHVGRFTRQDQDAVGRLRLELNGQLEVAVSVGQRWQREERLAGEVRCADGHVWKQGFHIYEMLYIYKMFSHGSHV